MYLEKINEPKDIKKLNIEELKTLADETREVLINKLSKAEGHQGPNLGVVELTTALHYVFSSPIDKIVFDVSHQVYPHKILTGRKEAFLYEEHFHDVTGYTNPLESEHDHFTVGHTSTSVSLALGLAYGRDLNKGNENIIALIGDGSLSGGEALEALDYAGEYNNNLIIVVNDNDQSIAENHGGMYKILKKLRETNGEYKDNIFKGFGLDYKYLDDGHDVAKLVELFNSVKDINHPIVLHIHTIKGKGLSYAEQNKEAWHYGGPFNISDGSAKYPSVQEEGVIAKSLKNLLNTNDKAIVLNAGTPMSLGFVGEEKEHYMQRGQFVDVGIAEENAMAMSSGIAKNKGTVVFGTHAPFLQRTYDQLSHDLCLNDNPATVLVLSPGIYGLNSNTHICLVDIQLFTSVANLIYLDPSSEEEYTKMFEYATSQKEHPVAIRCSKMIKTGVIDNTDYSFTNKFKVDKKGKNVAVISVGSLLPIANQVSEEYKKETGYELTVIHPCFLSGLDEDLLNDLTKDHDLIITLEDGQVDGGFGNRISAFYSMKDIKVKNLGLTKEFHTDFEANTLLEESGISVNSIINLIKENI